jgi:hypothetical protein
MESDIADEDEQEDEDDDEDDDDIFASANKRITPE